MNTQGRIIRNATTSILQVLVIGLALAFMYRYLLDEIGPEMLGLWSLVLATASLTQISNLGLIDSVVKFVAKYLAHGDQEKINRLLQTVIICVAISLGAILILLFLVSEIILGLIIEPDLLDEALRIFPLTLLSAWLMAIASIFLAGLDGYHRIDLRNGVMMANYILYVLLSIFMVETHGLRGLAVAQVITNLVLLMIGFFLVRRFVRVPLIPKAWDQRIFNEIRFYGAGFQVISITKIVFDPLIKVMVAGFGGLAMVAYYEMASKMVQQLRGVVVAANQVLVPTFAELEEREPGRIIEIYLKSYNLVFFITIPSLAIIGGLTPLISQLWLGKQEILFINVSRILLIGWFLNLLTVPAYYAYVGKGRMKWNVISYVAIAVLSLVFGGVLGVLMGGLGVVAGFTLALILGSLISTIAYHREEKLSLLDLVSLKKGLLVGGSIILYSLASGW